MEDRFVDQWVYFDAASGWVANLLGFAGQNVLGTEEGQRDAWCLCRHSGGD